MVVWRVRLRDAWGSVTVTIHPANLRDATWITANMREADRRELVALLGSFETAPLAATILQASGDEAYVAYLSGQPTVLMGLTPMFPGVMSGWAWGTRRMWRCVPEMTRFCRARWAEHMADGVRRIEVRTAVDHDLSHRWLRKLGAKPEGILTEYGDGLDFAIYALTRD